MSHDGRAVANAPDPALARKPADHEGSGAAGTFPPRLVPARKPLTAEDRVALRLLIEAGKMARQRDGGWGLRPLSKRLLTITVANRLKARDLAIPSFDKVTLYPSLKGKQIIAQEETDAGPPQ